MKRRHILLKICLDNDPEPAKIVRIEMNSNTGGNNSNGDGESENGKTMTIAAANDVSSNVPLNPEKCNECPICYQEYTYKTELPDCGHQFCFLCIKGVALRHGVCPLCRKRIPHSIFRDPILMTTSTLDQPTSTGAAAAAEQEMHTGEDADEEAQWFYEARHGGWWRYERRHEDEIEQAYQNGLHSIDLLIAGNLYCIDLDNMSQYRRDDARRFTRAIKRTEKGDTDLDGTVRGIAGLRTPTEPSPNTGEEQDGLGTSESLATITVRINTMDLTQQ